MVVLLWSLYGLHTGRENFVKSSDPFQTRLESDFRGSRLPVKRVWGGSGGGQLGGTAEEDQR